MPAVAPTGLPIEDVIVDVRTALARSGTAVLTAEPGAGKTTVVPLRLLDEDWVGQDRIVVLEPRRVAARAVARRMAELLGEPVGDTVGWRTRDDRRVSDRTRIEVVTEGILTRRIQRDPSLPGVAAVIFDEFHERSVHADIGLALTLDVRETIRPELRLLVMSATIDADAVAALIGGSTGPAATIDCPGRSHPVEILWRPRAQRDRIEAAVTAAVTEALADPGDVLVFLPGVGEIRRTVDALKSAVDADVRPLYGALSADEQDAALRPAPAGHRRVVVSTDVAETSLTVEGVAAVVDSGQSRRPRYDPATGLSRLVTIDHSKASADQRAGRAGRLGPGRAYRLWSKMEHAARPRQDQAEILQIDLAGVVLEAKVWGVEPHALRLLDPPAGAAIDEATGVLAMLGAIDADGVVTDAGRAMLALPVHPRLAAMLAAAGDGPLSWPAAILASLLTERDVIGGRALERPVDLWARVQLVLDGGRRVERMDGAAVATVRRRARELLNRVNGSEGAVHADDLGRTLALAYPDRIAQRRAGQGGRFRLRTGIGAEIDRADPLAHEDMLVVAELSGTKRAARITKATGIDSLDVELGFGDDVDERVFFGWDESRNDLVERVERRLGALDFGTHERRVEPSDAATAALVDHLVATRLDVLTWTTRARNLQARVELVTENDPASALPRLGRDALTERAQAVFGPYLGRATSRSDLESINVEAVLEALLGWEGRRLLDRLAPESWSPPRGKPLAIDYTAESPRVSVRVQALFGLTETPAILDGRIPLTLVLLSPANRPIQITSDLSAFWSGSWADVRKDMAGRYPKHDWPSDPLAG